MQSPQVQIIKIINNYPFFYRHMIIDTTMLNGGNISIQLELGIRPIIIVINRAIDASFSIGIRIFNTVFQTSIIWE